VVSSLCPQTKLAPSPILQPCIKFFFSLCLMLSMFSRWIRKRMCVFVVAKLDLFKHRVGFESGQGQIMGHLSWHISDSCLLLSRAGLTRVSLFDVSGRVCVGSGFGSKITVSTHPLHWLGRFRPGFFRACQVGHVEWPMIRSRTN
jgi:hypothetical protein